MACYYPWKAYNFRLQNEHTPAVKKLPDFYTLLLPCGKCVGCRAAKAKAWALRCHLELEEHQRAAFTTLTYDDKSLPPTLDKVHLAKFCRSLRKRMGPMRPIRFFACGEYGTKNNRPHYHAILYGADQNDRDTIDAAWNMGRTHTVDATYASINYVAGYVSEKYEEYHGTEEERVTPDGEVYRWQPPFLQMSRRPGIGAKARHKYIESWERYAVMGGMRVPVPRYLHEAWKATATAQEREDLLFEKYQLTLTRDVKRNLEAGEQIALARLRVKNDKRKL